MAAERVRGSRRALGRTELRVLWRGRGFSASNRGLFAAALLLLGAVGPLAAIPVTASATTAAPDNGETRVTLLVAPAASGIARPGDPLSVRVTVTNTGGAATPDLALALDLEGGRAASPERIEQWLAGATIDTDARTVQTATLSPLEPGASAVLDLIVPASRTVASGGFGARLAEVRATDDTVLVASDRTALVWVPGTASPPTIDTVFVAPLSTPGIHDGLLDAETLARLTAPAGDVTRQLDAIAGRPVLLAIDPRVVASIRLLGSEAPETAIALLDRLAAIPNETTLLPWADADLLAVLAAGGTAPLPEGARGEPPVDGQSETTEDGEPAAELDLAAAAIWPATFENLLWAEGGLTEDLLSPLAAAGVRTVITPSVALEGRAVVQTAAGLRIVRADAALGRAARDASTASSQQRFDRAVAQLSALLAAHAATQSASPVVIALGRDELPSSDRLVDTIARTVSLPWSTTGTMSAALAQPAESAGVIGVPIDEARIAAVDAALSAEAADRDFAAVATVPEVITDPRRLELLAALSQGWGERTVAALDGFVADSSRIRSSIRVAESSAITLLADRASLPVTIQNDLDVAVRVFVRIEPDTTQLRVIDPRVEVVVEPRSQTRALVPVESLTNGQVAITVTLRDATGARVGDATRVSLNLQAGWETAGTIAVGGAVVLLLVIGIARDIRKRRRSRAVDQSTSGGWGDEAHR